MTYTIRSATWGNVDCTSAVIMTDEVAAVAISAVDTPEEWQAFQVWAAKNPVTDMPAPVTAVRKPTLVDRVAAIEAKLGMVSS